MGLHDKQALPQIMLFERLLTSCMMGMLQMLVRFTVCFTCLTDMGLRRPAASGWCG